MVVLDTAALVYWTLDPERLTPAAARAIAAEDRLVVSSISVWEIAIKQKRGKLELPMSIDDYARGLQRLDRLEILPVTADAWLANLALDWSHRDPADRTIVATAALLGSALLTPDLAIQAYYPQAIW